MGKHQNEGNLTLRVSAEKEQNPTQDVDIPLWITIKREHSQVTYENHSLH